MIGNELNGSAWCVICALKGERMYNCIVVISSSRLELIGGGI